MWEFFSPFYVKKERMGWTNYIFKAHRYGYDFPGFAGRDLRPGGFDFVIKQEGEPGKGSPEPQSGNQRLRRRHYADYQAWDTERRIF